MKKGLLITLGVVALFAIITVFWAIGVSNSEIRIHQTGDAQQKVCAAFFDKMWKIIKQDAQVADKYKDAFAKIYPDLIAGRYSKNDGSLMKWITESNPNFDTKLYDKLMAAIDGERNGFFVEQEKLVDIDRQHKTMRQTFPNSMIIGSRHNIGYEADANGKVIKEGITIITSDVTENAYKSGKENDIDLK
jgi:hypothetical protein